MAQTQRTSQRKYALRAEAIFTGTIQSFSLLPYTPISHYFSFKLQGQINFFARQRPACRQTITRIVHYLFKQCGRFTGDSIRLMRQHGAILGSSYPSLLAGTLRAHCFQLEALGMIWTDSTQRSGQKYYRRQLLDISDKRLGWTSAIVQFGAKQSHLKGLNCLHDCYVLCPYDFGYQIAHSASLYCT